MAYKLDYTGQEVNARLGIPTQEDIDAWNAMAKADCFEIDCGTSTVAI